MLIPMRSSLNVLLILQHPKPSKEAQTGLSIHLFFGYQKETILGFEYNHLFICCVKKL